MALVLWVYTPDIHVWDDWDAWQRGVRLMGLCLAGLGAYGLGLWMLGLRPAMLRR